MMIIFRHAEIPKANELQTMWTQLVDAIQSQASTVPKLQVPTVGYRKEAKMTNEQKLKDVKWELSYHEKEAESHTLKAAAFRLLKDELERTIAFDNLLAETKADANGKLDAITQGMKQ